MAGPGSTPPVRPEPGPLFSAPASRRRWPAATKPGGRGGGMCGRDSARELPARCDRRPRALGVLLSAGPGWASISAGPSSPPQGITAASSRARLTQTPPTPNPIFPFSPSEPSLRQRPAVSVPIPPSPTGTSGRRQIRWPAGRFCAILHSRENPSVGAEHGHAAAPVTPNRLQRVWSPSIPQHTPSSRTWAAPRLSCRPRSLSTLIELMNVHCTMP